MISEGYKEYVIERINNYIQQNNKIPSMTDMNNISTSPLINEYGSWKNTLISFGFLENENSDEIFEKLLDLQLKLKHPLTMKDVKKEKINVKVLIRQYGSWGNVKKELIKKLPTDYRYKPSKVNDDFLKKLRIDEEKLIELIGKQEKPPTAKIARDYGININRLLTKYGTWNNAKNTIINKKS